jgi:sulfonate transport system permease protein
MAVHQVSKGLHVSPPNTLSSVSARWRGLVLPVAAVLLWALASR